MLALVGAAPKTTARVTIMRKSLGCAVCFLTLLTVLSHREAAAQSPRPFDDYTPPSSVSPYMNLMNNNSNGTDAALFMNYQLFVKPQLEQRRLNKQSATAIRNLQQQQQQSRSAKASSTAEGNPKLRSTGHVATRVNYSHYYPTLNRVPQ
jgi:hypothetical protein